MSRDEFRALISELTAWIGLRSLNDELAEHLNRTHSVGSPLYEQILAGCRSGIADGWMCNREAHGIRYGRVITPSPATHGFSVDVVDMNDCVGPHHIHPKGEIDLVMPLEGLATFDGATFDGKGAGWKVYGPGSGHFPTVSRGRALVLYLLPEGVIQFTGKRLEDGV